MIQPKIFATNRSNIKKNIFKPIIIRQASMLNLLQFPFTNALCSSFRKYSLKRPKNYFVKKVQEIEEFFKVSPPPTHTLYL